EELLPPIAVFIGPPVKQEISCTREDKFQRAVSSAGPSNEGAAGCVSDEEIWAESSSGTTARVLPRPVKKRLVGLETEETKRMLNLELTRLVLLEELQVLRLKKEKYLWEKRMRESKCVGFQK
ncbi:Protein of unknown function, partial [Gryllus bimaculatus]